MVQDGVPVKRVGFFIQANPISWLGGLNYLRNLLNAVYANDDRHIEPVIFVHPAFDKKILRGFPEVPVIRTSLASPILVKRAASRISLNLLKYDYYLESFLLENRIDALSHSGITGMRSKIASISWIPDFQHLRMPQYFSKHEIRKRNKTFSRIIENSQRIVLSSHVALRDFLSFAPNNATKARVLQFVSSPPVGLKLLSRGELYTRFRIDRPYFHLPNQFWVHKNHSVVIEALNILASRGLNVLVLATGNINDSRSPDHFQSLIKRVHSLDLKESFRVLGIVTNDELFSLMIHSIALINPSNFEGWSSTIEESKSLGVSSVLSSIPVHIEQAPPLGRYFDPASAEALADVLALVIREHDPKRAKQERQSAMSELQGRVKRFGKEYERIVIDLLKD